MTDDRADEEQAQNGVPTPSSVSPSAARLEKLEAQLCERREHFFKKGRRDKHKSYWFQISSVFLSATITVLLGLHVTEVWQDRFANYALAIGALLTVLSAADALSVPVNLDHSRHGD